MLTKLNEDLKLKLETLQNTFEDFKKKWFCSKSKLLNFNQSNVK